MTRTGKAILATAAVVFLTSTCKADDAFKRAEELRRAELFQLEHYAKDQRNKCQLEWTDTNCENWDAAESDLHRARERQEIERDFDLRYRF